jgi:hypothetical protein
MISIVFEVLNAQRQVIGRQTVEMDSRYSLYGTRLEGPGTAFTTVRFTGVKGDDITDSLSIRIASINGRPPEGAGISRIEPMSDMQMKTSKNYAIYNGAIRSSSNNRDLGNVTIPAELWGERVTAIAKGAFENSGLTGIIISEGVTTIGENAFANNKLASVSFPSSVISIGASSFASNQLTGIILSTSVTTIGASAFANNKLTGVIIPEGVTTIGSEAFIKNAIASLIIGNNVTIIGASAFANNRLTNVIIPEGVTTIGDRAFADNHWTTEKKYSDGSSETKHHGLSSVTITKSVTSIGQDAFASHWTNYYPNGNTTEHWLITEVTIWANVSLGKNAIGNGFESFYTKAGRQAGTYRLDENRSGYILHGNTLYIWERFANKEVMEQKIASDEKSAMIGGGILLALAAGGLLVWLIISVKNSGMTIDNAW